MLEQYTFTPEEVEKDGFPLEIDTDHPRKYEKEVFLLSKYNRRPIVTYDPYSARSFSNTNGGWRIQRYAMAVPVP